MIINHSFVSLHSSCVVVISQIFSEPPAQFEHKLTKHVGQLITNNEHSSMRTECFQTPGALRQLPPCCCDVLEKVTPGSISGSVHGNEMVFGNSEQRRTLSAVLQPLSLLCIFSLNVFFFPLVAKIAYADQSQSHISSSSRVDGGNVKNYHLIFFFSSPHFCTLDK